MRAHDYMVTLIARAQQLAGLSALITLDAAGALAAAAKVDEMRATGAQLPPLAGLPIVVKDNINSKRLPTTGGTMALRNARPVANGAGAPKTSGRGRNLAWQGQFARARVRYHQYELVSSQASCGTRTTRLAFPAAPRVVPRLPSPRGSSRRV